MRKYNLPIFIPHRGCPHDCSFCNQRKITGVDTELTSEQVRKIIRNFLATTKENSLIEVAFFGGSFTGLKAENQEAFLSVASEFFPKVDGIRISTRPDYIDDEIIERLIKYNVTTVELGVQSSDDEVLMLNGRGHSFEDVIKASETIKKSGITLGHQIMLGMFGSTPEKDMKTVRDVVSLMPECVRIYPVITLKGTELERLYEKGDYTPYSLETAAELAKEAVCMFRKNNIEVIRVGLHSSEELEMEDGIIAGPYHQAFGELVESLIHRELIEKEILLKNIRNCDYEICCKKGDISKVVGHKRMNKDYFREKYGINLKVSERQG